jgi:flagellar hook-length control protein FliK
MISLPALASVPARPAMQPDSASEPATGADVDASASSGFAAALEQAREPTKVPADGQTRAVVKASAKPGRGAEPKADRAVEDPAAVISEGPAASDETGEAIDATPPDLTALLPGWTPVPVPAPALTPPPMVLPKLAVAAAATTATSAADVTLAATTSVPSPFDLQAAAASGAGVRRSAGRFDVTNNEVHVAATEAREAPATAPISGPMAVPDQPLATPKSTATVNDAALPVQAAKTVADSAAPTAPSLPAGATPAVLPAAQATPQFHLNAVAAAVPPFEARLAAAIDTPGFAPALAHQVTWLASEGVQHARLTLNPADMGPLAVKIVLDGTQARIDFSADIAATRTAIEASLPTLAAALNDSGLTLAGGGVFDGQARRGMPDPRNAQPSGQPSSGDPSGTDAGIRTSMPVRAARGLVDLVA